MGRETLDRVFPGTVSGRDVLRGSLFRLAGAVDQLADDRPTLVVLDDLQWADPSSLDVLSYIVAGLHPGQQLALALAYRDTELGEGHRLHSWLADLRRGLGVTSLPLSRLSADETEQLVRGILGVQPDAAQAESVLARSEGNPYL